MTRVIEVKDLVKEFNGKRVLNGITFHVRRGEIFGLLGPNGAGKTTTIRILLGLLKPTSGRVLVLGGSLAEDEKLRRRVGVVLESNGLFPKLSVFENLEFYAKLYGLKSKMERKRRIKELLEIMNLYDVKDIKVGYLSKGMKRKLAIARALIHQPEVLFLDEPTSGLDPKAQVTVGGLITRLIREENVTILYTSHDLNEVQKLCSRVAILVRGRILALDTISNMLGRYSKPIVEVHFSSDVESSKAYSWLKTASYILECKRNGKVITLVLDGCISKLLRDIAKMNANVEKVRSIEKSLEEIYLEIIGRVDRS